MNSYTKLALLLVSLASIAFSASAQPESKLLLKRKAMEVGCYNHSRIQAQDKQAIKNPDQLWPDAVVPYRLAKWSRKEKKIIAKAMDMISSRTCVKFVKRTDQANYVYIHSASEGCFADLGMVGNGKQEVNLQKNGCVDPGTVAHELIHSLGIYHEQARTDRDDYVEILKDNIIPKQLFNFDIQQNTETYGLPYDFDSIMHYISTAFTSNGKETIVSKVPGKRVPPSDNEDLSENDVKKINALYGCQ